MNVRSAAAALLAVATLLGACSDDQATVTGSTRPEETSGPETSEAATPTTISAIDPVLLQLCGVLNAALAGEIDVAKTTFDHGPLHTLADEVIDIDRGVAARLLEAKEAVESALAAALPDAAALVTDLEALTAATAEALAATGTPTSSTCDLETP